MTIKNYLNYGMCIYDNIITGQDKHALGDVVINEANEIGVVIQIHSKDEFRTDMFGNSSSGEVRMATDDEIKTYRPDLLEQGKFSHCIPLPNGFFNKGNTVFVNLEVPKSNSSRSAPVDNCGSIIVNTMSKTLYKIKFSNGSFAWHIK